MPHPLALTVVSLLIAMDNGSRSDTSRLSQYMLMRVVVVERCPPGSYPQLREGVPLALEEYDLSSGKLISVQPACFGDTISGSAIARWKHIGLIIKHGSPGQRAIAEKLIPPSITTRLGNDACDLALLNVSVDEAYSLWGKICWATGPDCLYSMECYLVNAGTGEVIAERQFCNCLIRGDVTGFLGEADPFCYFIDRGVSRPPRVMRISKRGFALPTKPVERESIAASPDLQRVVIIERTKSQQTLVVELRDSELRSSFWKTALTLEESDCHPAAYAFWSEDSTVIAISIEGNPGRQDAVIVLDAKDGRVLSTIAANSRRPLSSDLVILQRRNMPIDFGKALGVRICDAAEDSNR